MSTAKLRFQCSKLLLHLSALCLGWDQSHSLQVLCLFLYMLHPSGEDPTNHPLVFTEYAEDDLWIASHMGQFAGGIAIFAGGFVALYRLLVQSESSMAYVLAWIGFAVAILSASTLAILQAVDGIALKRAVDFWTVAPPEEKAAAFQVAEGIRWIEISVNSTFRILQGAVGLIFGVAILKSTILSKWIGALFL